MLSPAAVGDAGLRRRRRRRAARARRRAAADSTGRPGRSRWAARSYSSPAVAPDGTVYVAHDRELVAVRDDGDAARVAWRFRDAGHRSRSRLPSARTARSCSGTNADDQYGLRARRHACAGASTAATGRTPRPSSATGPPGSATTWATSTSWTPRTGRPRTARSAPPKSEGTTSAGTGVWTAPLVDRAGNAYVGTAAGHVYGFAPDGARLWDADVGGIVASYPALTADGTLLIGSTNGTLYAFADA